MLGIVEKLKSLKEPIKVGIVGAGYMGSGVLNVISQMKGMEVVAIYDEDIKLAEGLVEAKETISKYGDSSVKVCNSIQELCSIPEIQCVMDAESSPKTGAEASFYALTNKKHVVSINIECDVTVGRKLAKLAKDNGVIYTVTAGDEPGELKRFFDHYTALNFNVIGVGKGKNNPLKIDATPDTVRNSLPDNGITAEQVCSFVDGSKTMFEMACISNATGLVPDVRGMHGPLAKISDLPKIFCLKEQGGILNQEGVVDYVTGEEISGGVFIIVSTENERIMSDFKYLKIGTGPRYVFYQRYHNWFIDMPLSVARAVLEKEPTIVSLPEPTSQVIAIAKKDLKKGDRLDGIGGFTVYGTIERVSIAKEQNLLPHGLIEICTMKKELEKGKPLTYNDVEIDEKCLLVKMM